MAYSIESIELFVREMPADRMSFGIGKADDSGKAKATKKRRPRAILLTQLTLKADGKGVVIGCSGIGLLSAGSTNVLIKHPRRN